MLELPSRGLYRTTQAMPDNEAAIPANVLVYVGERENGGGKFIVRPGENRKNRWFWGEPVVTLRSATWAKTLKALPAEGFYTLPDTIDFDGGGRWLKNAIVQLGYNGTGEGIIFVAEQRDSEETNALYFSDKGLKVSDDLLERLLWAPILPVRKTDA